MSKLSVKIRIADREYSLKVPPVEEERLRLAGKLLNERLRTLGDQYGNQDKQNLVAMAALTIMDDLLKVDQEKNGTDAALTERITRLDGLLSSLVLT